MNKCKVIDLGLSHYEEVRNLQEKIVEARLSKKIPDTLLLCEHYPAITLGRKKRKENLLVSDEFLKEKGIEIYQIERGGEATCHCPGQLVGYPIFDLRSHGMDLHNFLRKIEEVILNALSEIGIKGCKREGYTGVWFHNGSGFEKIAFIGIACRKWVSYHGFSLNIDCDLTPFSWIVPCGLEGVKITSVAECQSFRVSRNNMEKIKEKIIENFEKVFELDYEEKVTTVA